MLKKANSKNALIVHFMGVGGSGISGVALLAKNFGYQVSGCDLSADTAYIKPVKKHINKVYVGHNSKHINKVDLLVTSPAVLYQNRNHSELKRAREKRVRILTWEKFLGKNLLKGKKVICIAGTHGKSTTTALASLVFERSGLDPSVMIGANVKEWGCNFRIGKRDYFIVEADEFNNNFLNYSPDTIVINNIEFDHPDFFSSERKVFESFVKFVHKLKGEKNLIVNIDSSGVRKLIKILGKKYLKELNLISYSLKNVRDIMLRKDYTSFEFEGYKYKLRIPGLYNISNCLGVIKLSKVYKIKYLDVRNVVSEFEGIERRLDLKGVINNIKIYDDYAHHPTAVKATLSAIRQKYPNEKLSVIYEPHSYSRTKALLYSYKNVFNKADKVLIAPIYKARDKHDFSVSESILANVANHKNIITLNNFDKILDDIVKDVKTNDIILIMGAGKSYLLAKDILNNLSFINQVPKNYYLRVSEKLSKYTTLKIGGPARFFVDVKQEKNLLSLIKLARKYQILTYIIAGGSDLLISDEGFSGLIIRFLVNGIRTKNGFAYVKAGTGLGVLINEMNKNGYGGLECLAGIPGSVGGAIYGNAGAYGQEIANSLLKVKVFDGSKIFWMVKSRCRFSYRNSCFKDNKNLIILEAVFGLKNVDPKELIKKSNEIMALRIKKYPEGMKCPGSFFKNVLARTVDKKLLSIIPKDKIMFGKIPAGWLLESVGAKNKKLGKIKIADYHGNLFINEGGGKADDFINLSQKYADKVYRKFKIKLEPEVQLLGFYEKKIQGIKE